MPPPLFVVSLPGSARRARMASQLARWPGAWSFVDGVDGRSLSPAALAAVYDEAAALQTYGRPLSLPEIGCALSHRSVYEMVVRRRIESAIVLEDDACFGPELAAFPFWSYEPGFDVISLYSLSGLVRRRPQARRDGIALHRAAGKVDSAVGYVVSQRGAQRLLAAGRQVRAPADWPIAPERLEFYLALPFPVSHPNGEDSVIAAERERVRRGDACSPLTEGMLANVTIPLFIKYVLRRRRYIDAADYFRREIAYNVKRMLPMLYRYHDARR